MNLKRFTKKEIVVIDRLLISYKRKGLSPSQFMSWSSTAVSRPWLLKVLSKMKEEGFINSTYTLSKATRPREKFHLTSDYGKFSIFAERYLRYYLNSNPIDWQKSVLWSFMSSLHVQKMLNEGFVKYILHSRNFIAKKLLPVNGKVTGEGGESIFTNNACIEIFYNENGEIVIRDVNFNGDKGQFLTIDIKEKLEKEFKESVVIPILALIKISPTALLRFIQEWKPYGVEYSGGPGIASIEHVLFRLIWDAANDLSITRAVPSNQEATYAYVGSANRPEKSLLRIFWMPSKIIRYDVEFSTVEYYVGGEDSEDIAEVEINPEDAYVQIDIQDVQSRQGTNF